MDMQYSEWKEQVRLALLCAIKQRNGGDIARYAGVPRSSVHSYAKQGVAGPDLVQSIAKWLHQNGYIEGAPLLAQPAHPPEQAVDEIILLLERLIPLLRRTDIPERDRLALLKVNLEQIVRILPILAAKMPAQGNQPH